MFFTLCSVVVFTSVLVESKREVEKGCWPYNVIPYSIGKEFSEEEKQWIRQQISEVHRLSCVRWQDISENNLNVTDYALFVKTTKVKCSTQGHRLATGYYVVTVTLSDICFTWTSAVIHEMLHVMGFGHEHQRSDRDCYIHINRWQVLTSGKASQFDIIPQEEWLERFPYDKLSVMHYPRNNGLRARTERWYQFEPLGNAEGRLTDMDRWKIRYRFCNGPHYCDVYPHVCDEFDQLEKDCRTK